MLALSPGSAVPVARIVRLVWGDRPPRTADKTLQSYVTRLRKGLGPDSIVRTGVAYRLDVAAASVGIHVARYKLSAFVWSSAVTALAGTLFAYQRGFVSVEAFGFFVAVEYIAMIIIGGLGSALGAVLGAALVTLMPYAIDGAVATLSPSAADYYIFPAKFGAFGLLMALFPIVEPLGLVGIWRRVRNWFALWPFRHRPLRAS